MFGVFVCMSRRMFFFFCFFFFFARLFEVEAPDMTCIQLHGLVGPALTSKRFQPLGELAAPATAQLPSARDPHMALETSHKFPDKFQMNQPQCISRVSLGFIPLGGHPPINRMGFI